MFKVGMQGDNNAHNERQFEALLTSTTLTRLVYQQQDINSMHLAIKAGRKSALLVVFNKMMVQMVPQMNEGKK